MLRALAISLAVAWLLDPGALVARQVGYAHGVFVGTEHGPVELTAYAEPATNGQLRMAKGGFAPSAIFVATQEIFQDERAERREVRFALRRLNISALELRVEDLERQDRLTALIQRVGASEKSPAYVFVVMTTNGLNRFYPFRVRLE